MNCDPYRDLISAYLDGELSPQQEGNVRHHLSECEACRQLADELQLISRTVQEMPRMPLGVDMVSLVNQQLANEAKTVPLFRLFTSPRVLGTLATAAMVILALSYMLPGSFQEKALAPQVGERTMRMEFDSEMDLQAVPEAEESRAKEEEYSLQPVPSSTLETVTHDADEISTTSEISTEDNVNRSAVSSLKPLTVLGGAMSEEPSPPPASAVMYAPSPVAERANIVMNEVCTPEGCRDISQPGVANMDDDYSGMRREETEMEDVRGYRTALSSSRESVTQPILLHDNIDDKKADTVRYEIIGLLETNGGESIEMTDQGIAAVIPIDKVVVIQDGVQPCTVTFKDIAGDTQALRVDILLPESE